MSVYLTHPAHLILIVLIRIFGLRQIDVLRVVPKLCLPYIHVRLRDTNIIDGLTIELNALMCCIDPSVK